MAEIIYIKEGSAKGRVTIGIDDDGEIKDYSVTLATYAAIGAPGRYSDVSYRDLDASHKMYHIKSHSKQFHFQILLKNFYLDFPY